jgi:uncharacterized protein YbbC (DUF1343 family)
MSKNPPHENKTCYGIDFRNSPVPEGFTLSYLIDFYNKYPNKDKFFNNFFNLLAGNSVLRDRIRAGWDEQAIRQEWANDLQAYKAMRKKYLLYPD